MVSKRGSNKEERLNILRQSFDDCKRCKLYKTRNNIVFGEGNPEARVIFIGEGPGREEDIQGRPFVGRAGRLLTAIIEKGMNISRSDVYIANVVKCRPTINLEFSRDRPPDEDEISACGIFLLKQIEIIEPDVIVTLGNPSTRFLLHTKQGITKSRGIWFSYSGIPVMPTYHPSYVLRNEGESSIIKKQVWDDIKKVIERLNIHNDFSFDKGKKRKQDTEQKVIMDIKEEDPEEQGRLF